MKYFGEFTLKYNFDLKYNLTVISTVACSEEMLQSTYQRPAYFERLVILHKHP